MNLARRFLVVIFLSAVCVFAVEPPTDPTEPLVELADKSIEPSRKKDSKKDKNLKTAFITKDGIKYDKKLRITGIKQIKILSWELKKGKKTKEGTTYQTSPSRVQIQNTNAETFLVKGLQDTEFLNLSISNQNGIAKLYTFWVDLQYENGNWFS